MGIKSFRIILLTVACGCYFSGKAQQDPQFSMNFANKLLINPAYAGMNDGICAYLLTRQQWVGFEGNPETYVFGAHGTFMIPGINLKSGGGLTIMGDGLGQMHFSGIKGVYSAHIPLNFIGGKPGHLGIGVSAGMLQFSVGNNWRSLDEFYLDPLIPDEGFSLGTFDLDAGLYYKTKDLYVGLAASHLSAPSYEASGSKFLDDFGPDQAVAWNSSFSMERHYSLMAGYDFEIPNYNLFVLKPSVYIKSNLKSAQFDLNLIGEWNHFIWAGATYRYTDAAVVMGGLNLGSNIIPKGNIRFGYSYDITTSAVVQGSNGSHEFFAQYCLTLKKQPPVQKHKTVRFL